MEKTTTKNKKARGKRSWVKQQTNDMAQGKFGREVKRQSTEIIYIHQEWIKATIQKM